MKILVVEDDPKTSSYLLKGLTENGYTVDIAENGIDGLHHAVNERYQLILLDIMLPLMNGWTVIEKIRKENKTIPMLVLSSRDAISDRVKAFDLGADDYLLKPYSFTELLARIRALLKRSQSINEPLFYQIGDLEVNLRTRKVTRGGKLLILSPKEFALLGLLIQNPGEALSRTVITDLIWGINFDNDSNVVEVLVRRLRQKIDGASAVKLIHTIHGVGYLLELRS